MYTVLTRAPETDLEEAVFSLVGNKESYDKAEAYYEGDQDEVFTNPQIRRALKANGSDFRVNFASTVVDAVADRLEISSVQTGKKGNQSTLDGIWSDNQMNIEADEVHSKALTYGDAYLVVWPVAGSTQMYLHDPRDCVVIYDEEFPRIKKLAAKWWRIQTKNGVEHRLNLYYNDRIEKYKAMGNSIEDHSAWTQTEVVDNPFGEIPVFHFRTKRPKGRPEHVNAYGPQDAINKLIVTQMNTIDYQGAPQRYALASNQLNDEILDFKRQDTDRENLGSLKNGPGELWYLKGIDKVGQFEPGDPEAFLKPLQTYVKAMASLTGTPLHYFENAMMPSGESLRTAESPLIKKVLDRQLSFGTTWKEVCAFVLKIEGVKDTVSIHWHKHESVDELTTWEIAIKKRQAGLPFEQIMSEAGYSEDDIARIKELKTEPESAVLLQNGPDARNNLSTNDPSKKYNKEMQDGLD